MRVGVPTGRLWTHSQDLLRQLGFDAGEERGRRYAFHRSAGDLEALALKVPDIPRALADGMIDFAAASDEWLVEHGGNYQSLVPLCWYHVRICVLAPVDTSGQTEDTGRPATVATPYPRLAARLLPQNFTIRAVTGSVEAYPGRLTDLAVDCVETGTTAAANALRPIQELARCDVRLIAHPATDLNDPRAREIIAAAQAISASPQCSYATTPDRTRAS
ncbi:ATP phosphoribosyltransferase [Nocardia tengchongensis]|uniref:ATP phosphoribosyltransferase n=1 Tax=Nocardia tengchongensis TaxID=2055889 RepID=UPI0036AA6A47